MDYLSFIKEQLTLAGQTAQSYFGKVTSTIKPGDHNQVLTEADLAIGKQLVAAVQSAFPEHNIIDEEAGVVDKGSRYTWVIDPIDGTSNFAAGLPEYGIMIGLLEDATPIVGGVIEPAFNKLFLAQKGKGATCNGEPLHVTKEEQLSRVLVAYGLDGNPEHPEQTMEECQTLARLVLVIRNMRSSGCEAIDPMRVAEGKYGGRVNQTSKIWDNVGPQVICEEAGALFTDINGRPQDYSAPLTKVEQNFTTCVAPPVLHAQLQAAMHGKPTA